MDKKTKSFRLKNENIDKVIQESKDKRRGIGDTLDLIIEFYFEQNRFRKFKKDYWITVIVLITSKQDLIIVSSNIVKT